MKTYKAINSRVKPIVIRFYSFLKSQSGNFKRGGLDTNYLTWEDMEEFIMDSKFMARQLVKEHSELKKFTAGFGTAELCTCKGCEIARRLYGVQG